MPKLSHSALVLMLATLSCRLGGADSNPGDASSTGGTAGTGSTAGTVGTGGTAGTAGTAGSGGTGGTAGVAGSGDGGTGDAGTCACALQNPDAGSFASVLTSSWDCYCAAFPVACAGRLDSTVGALRSTPPYCYQIREYASCGMTVILRRVAGVDPGGRSAFDNTTGNLIGVEFGSDTQIQCPTAPGVPNGFSRFYNTGTFPGSNCAPTSCMGTCVTVGAAPTQTEQPCAL